MSLHPIGSEGPIAVLAGNQRIIVGSSLEVLIKFCSLCLGLMRTWSRLEELFQKINPIWQLGPFQKEQPFLNR
jgi:hypothetical protein